MSLIRTLLLGTTAVAAGMMVASVSAFTQSPSRPPTQTAAQSSKNPVIYLDQAWSPQDRAAYYWGSQGSALLSYDIYLALELAGSQELFNSPANSDRFGLLVDAPDPENNPDALPIGIAKAVVPAGEFKGVYAGMTCAACHTGQVQYNGHQIRIDGGFNSRIEPIAWMSSLSAALDATLAEPARFQRMLQRIRARGPIDEADLRKRLESDAVIVKAQAERAFIMPFLPGPGRLDALGSIHNSFAAIKTGIPENTRPTLAPVKPPFLWNAPQSAWVQWSGIADNPLPRNFGETLGVFARYDLKSATPAEGLFESTTDVKGLINLERLLRRLAPPQWPEAILGKLDQVKVEQGAQLFAQNCSECHTTYPYRWSAALKQGKRMIENALVPQRVVGTDGTQFSNVAFDPKPSMLTGKLAPLFNGKPLVSNGEFAQVLQGAIVARAVKQAGPFTPDEIIDMNGYANFGDEPRSNPPVRSYKAGPRDGVWSTGPFLHNGSVPNIYELLSPAAERSKTFYVGRDFDPVKLGIDTSGKSGNYRFDTSLVGNSNAGHSFQNGSGEGVIGRELTETERYALIEYLKSIPNAPGRVTPYGGPEKPALAADDPTWFNSKHRN
jgi:hypothetical protein